MKHFSSTLIPVTIPIPVPILIAVPILKNPEVDCLNRAVSAGAAAAENQLNSSTIPDPDSDSDSDPDPVVIGRCWIVCDVQLLNEWRRGSGLNQLC